MKKYLYNFLIFFRSINNYGLKEIFKIALYEFFYIIKFRDFSSLTYSDKNTSSYENVYKKLIYDTPYIPTPFYFLKIICEYLKKIKSDNFLILDLGCGYSRVQYFFSSYFNSFFFGVDIDREIIFNLKKKKIRKSNFLHLNLRKDKDLNLLVVKTKKIKKKKNLIIFFSDSFDVNLLKKVLKKISNEFSFYCILINVKNSSFLSKKYPVLFSKQFKNPDRNIKIYKI